MIDVRTTDEFAEWLAGLQDGVALAKIASRVRRLAHGNPGDVGPAGEGISEMRIHHGPGYRVYYINRGPEVAIVLCGGDKSTQSGDIARAKALAKQDWET